jgi:hypothetical protein
MNKFLKIFLILAIGIACSDGPPKYAIPEDDLVPMLVDFHLTYALQQSPDIRELIRKADSVDPFSNIFEKHGYSKAKFDTTISWYVNNSQYYVDMYNEVVMRLTQITDSIEKVQEGL